MNKPISQPNNNCPPSMRNSDTLIIQASIRGGMLNLRTSPKKSGFDLWGAAVVLARAAIRLEARSINDFIEDLFNPNI